MADSSQDTAEAQANCKPAENLLDCEEYLSAKGENTVPIGIAESGRVIICDLNEIPHILICGIAGTGKTAFVQTILSILLSKRGPDTVKILVYNSKRIEYEAFSNVPQLVMPVIYERDRVFVMLQYLTQEIKRRFSLLAEAGSRDTEKYNNAQDDPTKRIPELFVVLDDIATVSLKKYEMQELLGVLNNGRIAGIHVIIISSMSSTRVLQRELISNIPCRICFRLSSKTESRNILGRAGGEDLYAPGEMIYTFQNIYCKCKSAFATYENIQNVMQSVCSSAVSVTALGREASMLFSDISLRKEQSYYDTPDDYDDLLADAAVIVINAQKASAGLIQRQLRIGFNRAERIMDQLRSLGVVSREPGKQPGDVMMTIDEWNSMWNSEGGESTSRHIEENVKLRDFAELMIGDTTISIHDDEIHYTKPIMTRFGKENLKFSFGGCNIVGLIYKKPSLFSFGYLKFEFNSKTEIINKNPSLFTIDRNNISEVSSIEFKSNQDRIIRLFLQQLSEDIGVSIKQE